jgi:hypothetical protein
MKRYRIVIVDPLNTEVEWLVPGTYTLESTWRLVEAYNKIEENWVVFLEGKELRKQSAGGGFGFPSSRFMPCCCRRLSEIYSAGFVIV